MKSYSKFERFLAKSLGKYPGIKYHAKYVYQYINYHLHKESKNCHVRNGVCLKEHTSESKGSFWGYYDKSPIRSDKILFHSFDSSNVAKRQTSAIDIVFEGRVVSTTKSWNWQQGAMLSWIGSGGGDFIHNDFDGKKYVSKIINIETLKATIIDYPVYQVARDGTFALSLNFTRLARLRPDYGYFNLHANKLRKCDENDGTFYINLAKNTRKLIITLQDLAAVSAKPSMDNACHKVNHIMISPNGKRFMFLHRWYAMMGEKFTRLVTANIDGSDLYVIADDDMVSHCAWKNDHELIGYARKDGIADRYFLFKDRSDDFQAIGEGVLDQDGHPGFSPDEKWLLTDTYPDRARMSSILLYHLETQRLYVLGRFFCPMRYFGETRCDLHPRWNPDGRGITSDSTHTGTRQMYEMDVSTVIDSPKE